MGNCDFIIEQYRGDKLVRTFSPSGDDVRPWSMNVKEKSYLRTNGWVLSKILPTLVEGSPITSRVIPVEQAATARAEGGAPMHEQSPEDPERR